MVPRMMRRQAKQRVLCWAGNVAQQVEAMLQPLHLPPQSVEFLRRFHRQRLRNMLPNAYAVSFSRAGEVLLIVLEPRKAHRLAESLLDFRWLVGVLAAEGEGGFCIEPKVTSRL